MNVLNSKYYPYRTEVTYYLIFRNETTVQHLTNPLDRKTSESPHYVSFILVMLKHVTGSRPSWAIKFWQDCWHGALRYCTMSVSL